MPKDKNARFVVVCKTHGNEYLYSPDDVFMEKSKAMEALRVLRVDLEKSDMDSDDFEVVDCLLRDDGRLVTRGKENLLTTYDDDQDESGEEQDLTAVVEKPTFSSNTQEVKPKKPLSNQAELDAHTGSFSVFNTYAGEYWKDDDGEIQTFPTVEEAREYIKLVNDTELEVSEDEAMIRPFPEMLSPVPTQGQRC